MRGARNRASLSILLLAHAYGVRGCCLSRFRFAVSASLTPFCLCALALSFLLFLSPMGWFLSSVACGTSESMRFSVT